MKFPTFGESAGLPNRTSDEFTLNDGKVYFLVREKLGEAKDVLGEFGYALMRRENAQFETPYLSKGAMSIILARRNAEDVETCPDCKGTGLRGDIFEVEACNRCEGRGIIAQYIPEFGDKPRKPATEQPF